MKLKNTPLLIVCLLFLLGFVACSGDVGSSTNANNNEQGFLSFQILSCEESTTMPGIIDDIVADEGTIYQVLRVRIKNNSNEEYMVISPLVSFNVTLTNGHSYTYSSSYNYIDLLPSQSGEMNLYFRVLDGESLVDATFTVPYSSNTLEKNYSFTKQLSSLHIHSYYNGKCTECGYAKVFKLRDIGPAGGFIIYINQNYETDGWHYIEAAPTDLINNYRWGDLGIECETETTIGSGKTNTEKIISLASNTITSNAAKACNSFSLNSYSDWYLPSIAELNLMYKELKKYDIGGFYTGIYVSSSETSTICCYTESLSVGTLNQYEYRDTYAHVRPIRYF